MFKNITQKPNFIFAIIVIIFVAVCIETDIYIPSFPNMLAYFQTTESVLAWVLSINFLGMCIASVIVGPLSDSYGRKPVLTYGFLLFTLSSLGCYFSENMPILLFFRFLQGMSASVGFVVGQAIVFDIYEPEEAGKIFGSMNSLVTFTMAAAPVLGGLINRYYGFHANFLLITIFAFIGFLGAVIIPETNKNPQKDFKLRSILGGYKTIATHQVAIINLSIMLLIYSAYMVYVSYLSLVFMDHLKMNPEIYDYYQGCILLVFAFFSWMAGRFITYFGDKKTFRMGLSLLSVGGCALFSIGYLAPANYNLITIFMSIFSAGFALTVIKFYTNFMNFFGEKTGAAAAFGNILRFLMVSVLISFTGYFFNGPITTVTNIMFLLLAICVGLFSFLIVKGKWS